MTAIAIPFLLIVWAVGIVLILTGLREAQSAQSVRPLLLGLLTGGVCHGFLAWALLHV